MGKRPSKQCLFSSVLASSRKVWSTLWRYLVEGEGAGGSRARTGPFSTPAVAGDWGAYAV